MGVRGRYGGFLGAFLGSEKKLPGPFCKAKCMGFRYIFLQKARGAVGPISGLRGGGAGEHPMT